MFESDGATGNLTPRNTDECRRTRCSDGEPHGAGCARSDERQAPKVEEIDLLAKHKIDAMFGIRQADVGNTLLFPV